MWVQMSGRIGKWKVSIDLVNLAELKILFEGAISGSVYILSEVCCGVVGLYIKK